MESSTVSEEADPVVEVDRSKEAAVDSAIFSEESDRLLAVVVVANTMEVAGM